MRQEFLFLSNNIRVDWVKLIVAIYMPETNLSKTFLFWQQPIENYKPQLKFTLHKNKAQSTFFW